VAGSWRRLHNEELHNLYASPNNIRAIKSKTHIGKMINSYKMLVGKPEEKNHQEDQRVDGMSLRERWWESVDCIHLAQDKDQFGLL
jgi:hypothetical protein